MPKLSQGSHLYNSQTESFVDLWDRIGKEIAAADVLVLYAELSDFPLKGALIEAGIALGMGKPVIVCLPDAGVLPRSFRPVGSWIAHPLVTRIDNINAVFADPLVASVAVIPVSDSYVPNVCDDRSRTRGLRCTYLSNESK